MPETDKVWVAVVRVAGGFVQDGWAIVMKATTWQVGEAHRGHWQADLPWWADQIRLGLRSL